MTQKTIATTILTLLLWSISCHSLAGPPLYRFQDENGLMTLSNSLPPSAAQKGYDVIDSTTMRLIERVPPALTEEEIAIIQAQQEQAIIEEEARQKQEKYDNTLLMSYQSESDLIAARDKDINYRNEQIALHKKKLPDLEQHLISVQKEAAQRELSGGKISVNLQKRLDAAENEIALRKKAIVSLEAEIDSLNKKYQTELERLQYLFKKKP